MSSYGTSNRPAARVARCPFRRTSGHAAQIPRQGLPAGSGRRDRRQDGSRDECSPSPVPRSDGLVLQSADQFKEWFDAPASMERFRALREPAPEAVWFEVISRFPECRADVARNPEVPLSALELLRQDDDEHVRWRVRTNEQWLQVHPEDGEPWNDDPSVPVQLRLTEQERDLLEAGLGEWGGPASCTDEMAVAMGFDSVDDLFVQGRSIREALAAGRALSRTDWTRALIATEVVFVSTVVGAGWDWETVTGFDDGRTLDVLRGLQRRVPTSGVLGVVFGTRPKRGRE